MTRTLWGRDQAEYEAGKVKGSSRPARMQLISLAHR